MKSERRLPLIVSIALAFVVFGAGCGKPPAALISRALAATNVVFQTHFQEPIALSEPAGETVRQIVKRFGDPSCVEARKDILPAFTASFVLGDVWFGWLGNLLCLKDPNVQRYYVVQDDTLGKMSKAYFKALGPPPMDEHELSSEEWRHVIAVLETANEAK